jgi:hypothetical protein
MQTCPLASLLHVLVRRLLKRSSFTSTEDLQHQILDFIDYFNRTLASLLSGNLSGFLNPIKLVTYFCQRGLVFLQHKLYKLLHGKNWVNQFQRHRQLEEFFDLLALERYTSRLCVEFEPCN